MRDMVYRQDSKIAWLRPGNRFHGPKGETYWRTLLVAFQEAFPRTTFVTTGEVSPECGSLYNIISVGKGSWRKSGRRKKGFYNKGRAIFSVGIVPVLFKLRPEVVITTEFTVWTMLSMLFKRLGRWKTVVLYEGYSASHAFEDDPIRLLLRKWTAVRADAFVTNSRRGREYLTKRLGTSAEKVFRVIHEIPAIPNPPGKRPDTVPISEGKRPRFLCVGHLIHRKGVDLLLKSWGKFRKTHPGIGSLWIIGDGDQREVLAGMAEAAGSGDIHFKGAVNNESLGGWYESCDVFVFPTREDTWGVVTLEAMGAGKAVLCSRNAGSSELVENGENGFVFVPEDTGAFAELMEKFAESPGLAERFGRRSRKIMKEHTHENAVKGLGAVIFFVTACAGKERDDDGRRG
jgi:glycosyltransferase involved in cell wall biosynthesis